MNNPNLKRGAYKMMVNNPYHHDFVFNEATYFSFNKLFFTTFDLVRVFAFVFVVLKCGMKAPQYLMFKRKNFLNHPDYLLVDETEFDKLRNSESPTSEEKAKV